MTTIAARWQPFGPGRQAPAGSLRDARLAARLAAYKHDVAGAYRSLAVDDLATVLQAGPCHVSPKVDGMTAYLHRSDAGTVVLTPSGQVFADLPLTAEADQVLGTWHGLLAGELYATSETGRPTIAGVLSALGGGASAAVDRLRFAAFDLLQDGEAAAQARPFADRAARLHALLGDGTLAHAAPVTVAQTLDDLLSAYQRIVIDSGGEGLVLHTADGRTSKVKPVITLDAAVVGYTAGEHGVCDLLLGLLLPDQPEGGHAVQVIGRVDTGFTDAERRDLAHRLACQHKPAPVPLASRAGRPYQWVAPTLVVEVRCHEVMPTDAEGWPIRRWRAHYTDSDGWSPVGKCPSVSLRDAVFVRVRNDKGATTQAVRWSQITDLVPVSALPPSPDDLPPAEVVRRVVATRTLCEGGVAVRKVVVLACQAPVEAGYPPYLVCTTDYSPARQDPLRTGLQAAGTAEAAHAMAEAWLAAHVGRGWQRVAEIGTPPAARTVEATTATGNSAHTLTIACARSTSPTFPIVRRRFDALAELGTLTITKDDRGKEVWFELTVGDLVPSYRRIANLLALVRRWKTCEISLDGDVLDRIAVDDALNRLEDIRRCWARRQAGGAAGCRQGCALGCDQWRLMPSQRHLQAAVTGEPAWWTVGQFDGRAVHLDKAALLAQLDRRRNRLVACCPHVDRAATTAAIAALPDSLTSDGVRWQTVYHRDDGSAAWVWPVPVPLPPRLTDRGIPSARPEPGRGTPDTQGIPMPAPRRLPATGYADVRGQDEAIAAVREMIELPMRHAAYFTAVGATPRPGGVLLAGPPGTGKTLLARAVASECGAHLETIAGPEILSQWVGGSEQALRDVFARAALHQPSLVVIDELDSIAPSRSRADAQHQQSLVAQLLVLLDGLDGRDGIAVLATTNRPQAIDPALRRPGRFDRVVWMRPPDAQGRAAILRHHLAPLHLADDMDREALADHLAAHTDGATGADLAFLCQAAARQCVQEALRAGQPAEALIITAGHLEMACAAWQGDRVDERRAHARR